MSLKIALIYPELLGTYGDRGNALVLNYRAKVRGIDSEFLSIAPGEQIPKSADIYLLGGGEDNAQVLATELLFKQIDVLTSAIETSQLIAVCAGFQILGNQFPISDGKVHEGLGIIDVTTRSGSPRIIGEVVTNCVIDGIGQLTGFENHGGRTVLGTNARPLGSVTEGKGNGIETDFGYVDGFLSENIFATYLHGPLFARNPLFADYIISKALGIEPEELKEIEDDPAQLLHRERLGART